MRRRTFPALLAFACTLALVAGACGGGDGGGDKKAVQGGGELKAQKGGTFRVGIEEAFNFTGGFDPTGEYLSTAWSFYRAFLARSLMSYNLKEAAEGGNEVVPDLAAGEPEISEDGLTYTFKLKDGVKFGPPVSREITSKDVAYAFERIATEKLVAQYYFYYVGTIEGMQEMYEGKAKTISGITTPDDKTIVFKLTTPTGDFPFRVAMPASAPIPREVAKCFTEPGEYGRYVISSGPYMIEGSDQLDISSCKAMKPIAGFKPDKSLSFVRNPDYDQATDDIRDNFPDKFTFTVSTNTEDMLNRVTAGDLETTTASPTPKILRQYSRDEELKDRLVSYPADGIYYMYFNLTTPPFDDLHVRIAANYAMDKEGLQRATGGPIKGEIATHIVPDSMYVDDELKDYDPYPHDLEQAKEHMKQSKYDTDKDGICDAPECKNILHIAGSTERAEALIPTTEASFKAIGLQLETRALEDYYTLISNVSKNVPFSSAAGWFKDYSDPYTFMVLFQGSGILATGNYNYSLVGITPEQAKKLGAKGNFENVPSVDADIEACQKLTDTEEREQCWQDLDKKLMEEVVPWIPFNESKDAFVVGPRTANVFYDQASGELSWSHIGIAAEQTE